MSKVRKLFQIYTQEGPSAAIKIVRQYITELLTNVRFLLLRWKIRDATVVRLVNGYKMELDIDPETSDRINKLLAVNGVREPFVTDTYREVLEKLKLRSDSTVHVFDVGANIGYYVLLAADILGDRGRIYAIEPEPDNAEHLRHNVELNDYSTVDVSQMAVGAEPSTMQLNLHKWTTHHWLQDVPFDEPSSGTITVEVTSIDGILSEREVPANDIILIRMDIQGYEDRAFDGMEGLLDSDRPILVVVELHPRTNEPGRSVLETLARSGFSPEYAITDAGAKQISSFDEVPLGGVNVIASRSVDDILAE